MNIQALLADHKLWLDTSGKEGKKVCFHEVYLQGANLRGADLRRANLQGADLRGADLRGVDLRGVSLLEADLLVANLQGAYLPGANLRGADLRRAKFRGADLQGADLRGADLREADLQGADLSQVIFNDCTGNGIEIITMFLSPWNVCWSDTDLAIGCQQHPIDEWWQMDNETITRMHPNALEWWNRWKEALRQLILASVHKEVNRDE